MRKLACIAIAVMAAVSLSAQSFTDSNGRAVVGNVQVVSHVQVPTLRNSSATSAAATALTASIAAVSGQAVALYSIEAYCSSGTATVTVKDGVGGTVIWLTAAGASTQRTFFTPIASTKGNGMDVVLGSCGTSNTGTLNIQASQF